MSTSSQPGMISVQFVSDSSLLIQLHSYPSVEASQLILNIYGWLEKRKFEWQLTNLHPAYCSLLVDFDVQNSNPEDLKNKIEKLFDNLNQQQSNPTDVIEIPVMYGGENGADLEEVANLKGLSTAEVVRLHSEALYNVSFLGFAPGFPYLLGLPEKLICPRKKTPRTRVPAGSVAIAGNQTGIYPTDSPGGWQLIGRTGESLFDPHRNPITLLKPGDRVRFIPTEAATKKQAAPIAEQKAEKKAGLKVENGGFFSTVQDSGRKGYSHLGVSAGGAADPIAFRVGNQILGNSENAAALEMTFEGGTFIFLQDTWFAVTGAESSIELDQQKISMWTSIPVSAGQRLVISAIRKNLRSYLCLHGGIEVDKVLESRSTFVSGCWGGLAGRQLQKGDRLAIGREILKAPSFRRCDDRVKKLYNDGIQELRVTKGPQWSWFSENSQRLFFSTQFEVTNDANRLGIRLNGLPIELSETFRGQELVSEGIANGAIQIPLSGQPMLLFCEQTTTGGYAKIANVIKADWYRIGQMKPGDKIRFIEVELKEAWRLNQEMEATLATTVREF